MALELEVVAHMDPSQWSFPSLALQIQTCGWFFTAVTAALLVTAQEHKHTELETRVSLSETQFGPFSCQ